MTWVRIDDGAPEHPKLVGLGDDAFALWARALCYCNRVLTDGFVPSGALSSLSKAKRPADVAAKLVAAKLWEPVDGGYQVHDYADYQPSRAEIDGHRREKSEAKRRAGQAGGKRSGEARRAKPGRSTHEAEPKHDDKQDEAPIPIPVPEGSPPVSPPQGGTPAEASPATMAQMGGARMATARATKTAMPEDWKSSPALRDFGVQLGLDAQRLELELDRFRDHVAANATRHADWEAAARNWLRKAGDFARERGCQPTSSSAPAVDPPRSPRIIPCPPPALPPETVGGGSSPVPQLGARFKPRQNVSGLPSMVGFKRLPDSVDHHAERSSP